ncbi:MAG: serine/threonine protein kinase [Thermoguttaceae bacterium]|nr:serine/threonine protein kinase [Thermoguttaceae bacterium]
MSVSEPFPASDPSPCFRPGTRLGDYVVERQIGSGGMAGVWLARHIPLDRPVALKILRAEFAADPRALFRFNREARSAARLDSPAIVRIYEVGQFGGRHPLLSRLLFRNSARSVAPVPYIAEEYVPGMNLAECLRRRGVLSVRQTLTVLTAVARALEEAHRAGIIHRDIKPENILLSEKGEIKVADFGIAFYDGENRAADLSLTRAGVVLGTPLYMSPEQGEGKAVDARSDLYSLGAAAFRMLTGRAPYEGGTSMSVLLRHAGADVPDPRLDRAEIPDAVAELVMRLMAKQPADRFASASELLAETARIKTALFGGSPPSGPDGAAPEENLFAEPDERLGFTRELGVFNATCRFQNSLLEMNRLEEPARGAKRWTLRGAALLAVLGAALLAGGIWTFRRGGAAESAPPEIRRLDSVEEQWVFALQTETASAWESLLRFYPDDPYWTVKAERRLAPALVEEGRTKEAAAIFDGFAQGRAQGLSGIPFGLAGQAWICAAEGDASRAASLLSELRKEGKTFDPQTEALISKAGALMRNQP